MNTDEDAVLNSSDEFSHKNDAPESEDIKHSWLLGSSKLDTWVFSGNEYGQYACYLKMGWQSTFKVTSFSTRALWRAWVEYAKELCIYIFDSKERTGKASSYKSFAQNTKSICQFFCFTRHCAGVIDVQKSDVRAFEDYLSSKDLSQSYVAEMLRTLRLFWVHKVGVGSGLAFDPYPNSVKINLLVKKLSCKNGHTQTLKPEVGLHLIEHALELVSSSESILERFDAYMESKELSVNHPDDFKQKYNQTVSIFFQEVQCLYGAAIVLVFGLSAMRKHESNQIRYDDAKALAEGDVATLTGRVHKTAKTSTGRVTERQVVKELQDAIKIIVHLTRYRRKVCGSELFLLRLPFFNSIRPDYSICNELATNSMYIILDHFAVDAGYDNGTLRPHMFRRFFAMMWAWRFETGDLHYLSKLLYHNGYEFTTAYTEDEDVWEFMPEEMKQMTHDLFEKMLAGEKRVVSGFSRTIERYKKLLQANVTIVTPEQISDFVDLLIERSGYIVTPAADGYCFMNLLRASRAKCSINGEFPDYANRDENLCSQCSNFGVTDDRKQYWQIRFDAHKKTFENARTKELKDVAKKGMSLTMRMLNAIGSDEVEYD